MIEGADGVTLIDCNEGVGVGVGVGVGLELVDELLPPPVLQAVSVMRRNVTAENTLTRSRVISPRYRPCNLVEAPQQD
jgi:hypothetical protein